MTFENASTARQSDGSMELENDRELIAQPFSAGDVPTSTTEEVAA